MIKIHAISCLCLCAALLAGVQSQDDESLQNPKLKEICSNTRRILRRHYPEATSHLLKNKIHFEYDTRLFIVHIPLKTGKWQDPREERGPKKGGVLGTIELKEGDYVGAARIPQTFDYHYYKVMVMAPYSKKHNCHLFVRLYVPRFESKPEFIKEFTELVNSFESMIKE